MVFWGRLALRSLLLAGAVRIAFLVFAYFLHAAGVKRHHIESTSFVLAFLSVLYLSILERSADDEREQRSGGLDWSLVPTALSGAFLLYWPALTIGWLSDDWVLADWAKRGEFIGVTHEFVRPIPLLIWRAVFAMGGAMPATHVLNVTLHGFNAALTGLISRALGCSRSSALVITVLFLVWPTQVETAVWASAIFDALMTTAVLAVIFLYLRFTPGFTPWQVALLLVIAMFAVLTKETAVVIPALLITVSLPRWAMVRPRGAETVTIFLLSAWCSGYALWRAFIRAGPIGTVDPILTRYELKEIASRAVGTLAVPFTTDTIATWPFTIASITSALIVTALSMVLIAHFRHRRHVLAIQGLTWSLLCAAPALGYLFIGAHLEGSRYLYLAATGWTWFIVSSVEGFASTTRLSRLAYILLITGLIVVAVAQDQSLLADWRTAADTRDVLLSQARVIAEREGCEHMHLADSPLPYKGTHLFENGFELAFESAKSAVSMGKSCEVRWDGVVLHLH